MRSELSHLLMRRRAYEKRKRREEVQTIGLRNEVRQFAGGDPIESPYSTSQDTNKDEQARHAMLRQTDFDDTEPLAPDDMSQLD